MKGWKTVGVDLPPSVVAIITAAGGADPKKGGMPYALAGILGALPWIAAALYKQMPESEYRAFAKQAKANMDQAWEIIGAKNPPEAFDAAFAAAKRSVN